MLIFPLATKWRIFERIIVVSLAEQRKQFVLINRTKPLPQGMIFELLPEIDGCLPQHLVRQRQAAALTARLNLDPNSSLYRRIRTPTCPVGVIKDNSIRRTVLNSLNDGALFQVMQSKSRSPELLDTMAQLVSEYWLGVQRAFPEAWNLPPKSSRLTHGAGVVALGYVMDQIYARKDNNTAWTAEFVAATLEKIKPYCAWTQGKWCFGDNEERPWNAIQNTDRDVRILANYFRRLLEDKVITR